MELGKFFKLAKNQIKSKFIVDDHYTGSVAAPVINLYSESACENIHEKLISKLYRKTIEEPDLYKKVELNIGEQSSYKYIIINNTRLKFYNTYKEYKAFKYDWVLEYEVLDTQALFPEYVDGKLAQLTYDFDVRTPYAEFIKEFFNKKDIEFIEENLL